MCSLPWQHECLSHAGAHVGNEVVWNGFASDPVATILSNTLREFFGGWVWHTWSGTGTSLCALRLSVHGCGAAISGGFEGYGCH